MVSESTNTKKSIKILKHTSGEMDFLSMFMSNYRGLKYKSKNHQSKDNHINSQA